MQPQRACGFVCVVLAGTSEGLAGPSVLEGACYRCCDTERSCGIVIVEILHCGESGDVKQVARSLKQISRVYDCFSLSHLCLYFLHAFIVYILTCLIYLCFIDIHD